MTTTMIVSLGERKMMKKDKRAGYNKGCKVKKDGNASARRAYGKGGSAVKSSMRTCTPN